MMDAKNILLAVAASTFMSLAAAETVERSSGADPRGDVDISNVSGTVRVIGWERAEVQVTARLGKGVERLDFARDGAHTMIHVVEAKHGSSNGSDLTVHVPRDSELAIHTVSADQSIEEVHGVQRLQSVSGDIRTQVWGGEFEANTVSGEIIAKGQSAANANAAARVHVSSVSGDVEVSNLGEDLDLSTVSGDMKVSAQSLARARIRTTNGSVHLTAALARDARIDGESVNGDLTFTFNGGIDSEFDIKTFNGRIDNCFGPSPKRTSEYGPGNELRFKEGEGHGSIRIKTLNGKVGVCRSQRSSWQRDVEMHRTLLLG